MSLNKEGLIETHEDLWSFADLIESIPLIGRMYRWGQLKLGAAFCWMMNMRYARQAGVSRHASLQTNTLHSVYHPVESQRISAKTLTSGGKSDDEVEEQEQESSEQSKSTAASKKHELTHRGGSTEHKSTSGKNSGKRTNQPLGGEEKLHSNHTH